jgi:NAD dependent epimerase/dehydratase family enzyme
VTIDAPRPTGDPGLTIAVFGGTGSVGAPLCAWLAVNGHRVIVLTRSSKPVPAPLESVVWSPDGPGHEWLARLGAVDAVVNLARTPLPGPFAGGTHDARRHRLELTRVVTAAVGELDPLPRVYVGGASHDVYGRGPDATALDESAPPGTDPFARLHADVESCAHDLQARGVRVVHARLGIVLGRGGNDPRHLPSLVADPAGALSWIHISDAIDMIERVIVDDTVAGAVNMTAPRPTTAKHLRDLAVGNRDHRRAQLRASLRPDGSGTSRGVASPAASHHTASADSDRYESQPHWVFPAKLMAAGYRWRVTEVVDALDSGRSATDKGGRGDPSSTGVRHTVTDSRGAPVSWTELGTGFPLVVCSAAAVPHPYWRDLLELLAVRYRTLFLHPRGLWGGHLPADLSAMSVADHARDLSALVQRLELKEFGIIGHCSGVATVVEGLASLSVRPRRVLLVSAAMGPGPAVANFEQVMTLVRSDARFREHYTHVAAAYAPDALRSRLESELTDVLQMEGHMRAVQSVREYAFERPWPDDVSAAFAWAGEDTDRVRATMRSYAAKLGPRSLGADELTGDHFTFLTDPGAAARIVDRVFRPASGSTRATTGQRA